MSIHEKLPSQELRKDYFGYRSDCKTCGRSKQPQGRSTPWEMYMCNFECKGYYEEPLPSNLWPGESEFDFGYKVSR